MGNFNAKVGRKYEKVVGTYGLGDKNQLEDRLIEFLSTAQSIHYQYLVSATCDKAMHMAWSRQGSSKPDRLYYDIQ